MTYLSIRLAAWALLPLLLLYAAWRCLRQPAYVTGLKERLGFLPASIPSTKPGGIWLHAVSVGEVLSAVPLLRKLRERLPETPLFVSTGTLAGRALALERLSGLADGVFFAPIDYPFAIRRVLRRIAPALFINLETEIWPNLLREVKRSGARWAHVNARISDRAWPRYWRFAPLFRAILPQIDFLAVQSEEDSARFRRLGFTGEIASLGNLKFDAASGEKPVSSDVVEWLGRQSPKPLWIAASTMGPLDASDVDEDDLVLEAFQKLEGAVRLLIAPRKPERFDVVAAKITARGIPFARRKSLLDADVLLLDSIGELAALFEYAEVVFVGGSFNRTGGHNILEPAGFGKPIVTGPNMANFAAIQRRFLAEGAVTELRHPNELAGAIGGLLQRGGVTGRRAGEVACSMRGAVDRLMPALVELYGKGLPRHRLPLETFARPLTFPWIWISTRAVSGRRLGRPVISVGNISMGGTGKTPLVLALGDHFASQGKRVSILTRGYGRKEKAPRLVLPGESASFAETGDEAQLYLRDGRFAVGIAGDRFASGAAMLERFSADVILLDDGFQHRRLHRDLDLVVVDALNAFPGFRVPPAGLLREPLSGLARADAFLLARVPRGMEPAGLAAEIRRHNSKAPIWVMEVEERLPELAPGVEVRAFCGLGNPASFRQTLYRLGLGQVPLSVFPDHYRYSREDVRRLGGTNVQLLTTAKDWVRLDEEGRRSVLVVEQRFRLPHPLITRVEQTISR